MEPQSWQRFGNGDWGRVGSVSVVKAVIYQHEEHQTGVWCPDWIFFLAC